MMTIKRPYAKRIFGLLGCLCIALSGCGDSGRSAPSQQTSGSQQERASAAFSVRWHAAEADQSSDSSMRSAIATNCEDIGVVQVECVVYDDKNEKLASGSWPCSSRKGEPLSIIPGADRHFVVLGRDADGDIVYHGISTATVRPGEETAVGPIDAYSFLPSGLKAESVADTQINISWTAADERARIDGYQVYNITDDTTAFDGSQTFSDQGLMASTQYCYRISVHDEFDNLSKPSDPICFKTTNRISDTGQPNRSNVHGDDGEYSINPPSYTKMDADGNLQTDDATDWAMIRDNATGLIWEVKTKVPGTRYAREVYHRNNTYKHIDKLNGEALGGYADWRVPSMIELFSLFCPEKSGETINVVYFPNSDATVPLSNWDEEEKFYWTAERADTSGGTTMAWCISFSGYPVGLIGINERFMVRAVRGSPKTPHLVDNKDGTVTDKSTGLMWVKLDQLKTARFFDVDKNEPVGLWWADALAACEDLSFAGYDDWRLPNVKELFSLTVTDKESPAIDTAYFNDIPEAIIYRRPFWSSTTSTSVHPINVNHEEHAYTVGFYKGGVGIDRKTPATETSMPPYVRPVRTVTSQ